MITDEKINQILEELYMLDPELKNKEKEIRQIINQLILSKPDVKIDEKFTKSLREEITKRTVVASQRDIRVQNQRQFSARNGKFSQSDNLLNKLKLLIKGLFMKKINYGLAGLAVVALIVGGYFFGQKQEEKKIQQNNPPVSVGSNNPANVSPIGSDEVKQTVSQVKKFASNQEFMDYLSAAQSAHSTYGYGIGGGERSAVALDSVSNGAAQKSVSAPAPTSALNESTGNSGSDRVSETNVQVKGIDEPDIVKTDGKNLYVSIDSPNIYYDLMPEPMMKVAPSNGTEESILPYRQTTAETRVISALPPSEIKQIGKIDKQGDMLLSGNNLAVFTYEGVYGYDIKDPKNPKSTWKIKYENNSQLTAARLYNGKIYLVTSTYSYSETPCPFKPLSLDSKKIEIACTDIYHPVVPISDVITYSAFSLNPENGQIANKISFVGSSQGQAIVYMSENSLYVTYNFMEDQVKVVLDFLKTSGKGIFPQSVMDKINKLAGYDISQNAKSTELQTILQKYLSGLDQDAQVKFQNDLQNKASDYLQENMRSLQFTGIAKISLDGFQVTNTGSVPGTLLNQFSLDEYKGNLRVATTIGNVGLYSMNVWRNSGTVNDVYVLDSSLNTSGSVRDLGKGERIYSARFINDKGYLVTFKQTDPFYVLDLSDPKKPVMKGELKIPGFSSYLHPLAENRILGVGQENGRVKLSLFDVSDASNPKEIDKYQLEEYWTEVSNNHHAFLQDSKHGIFFLPGGSNAFVFSYKNDKLSLEKAISHISQPKRALYINDSMYIVSQSGVVVIDENNWNRVGELEF